MFDVLLADDDSGMRMVLRKIIEKNDSFCIVDEAKDGKQALEIFEKKRPQVVFFDVDMPNLNGIEAARKIIDIDPKTIIIFATAHEEYMGDAFELYAFDYLLKPFKVERVLNTLYRIINLNKNEDKKIIKKDNNKIKKLVLKNKEGISFVDLNSIILIQREDRSTVIYTKNEKFTSSDSLSEIYEKLDKRIFFRSHKSYIINLQMISKISPYGRWTYIVNFHDFKIDALITSAKFEEIEEFFS